MIAKFRTPTRCHNGHFRWYYWSGSFGEVTGEWGEKNCDCKVGPLGAGYEKCGDDEMCTGEKDSVGKDIYQGDVLMFGLGSIGFVFYENAKFQVENFYYQAQEVPGDAFSEGALLRIIGNKYETYENTLSTQ